jgi:hypothetical protein
MSQDLSKWEVEMREHERLMQEKRIELAKTVKHLRGVRPWQHKDVIWQCYSFEVTWCARNVVFTDGVHFGPKPDELIHSPNHYYAKWSYPKRTPTTPIIRSVLYGFRQAHKRCRYRQDYLNYAYGVVEDIIPIDLFWIIVRYLSTPEPFDQMSYFGHSHNSWWRPN